jgi:hypothetical protein
MPELSLSGRSTQAVRLKANILAGTGSPALMTGGFASTSVVKQDTLITSASNFTNADNITSPNFWPNATVQAQIGLGYVPDTAYTRAMLLGHSCCARSAPRLA